MEAAYSLEPLVYTRSAVWKLHSPVELTRDPSLYLHAYLKEEVYLYL